MRSSSTIALVAAFVVAGGALHGKDGVSSAGAKPKLAEAAWLAGAWRGDAGGGKIHEEHWMAPHGDSMTGMYRTGDGKSKIMHELLLLEQEADGVHLRIGHFGAAMKPLEEEPLEWTLTSATSDALVFENPARERVRRIEYRRSRDELRAELVSVHDGKEDRFVVRMSRAK